MDNLIHHVATVLDAKKAGRNYVALCPICKNPKWTLNIWTGEDGKIGLRCYYSVLGQCHTMAHVFHLQSLGVDIGLDDITGSKNKPSDTWASIWHGAHGIKGSYVEEYLYRRGIDINLLPAYFLDSLRCVDYLKHPMGIRTPAMIGLMRNTKTNEDQAIHRTYLNPLGTDKFDGDPNKMTLGPTKGGVVMFGEPQGSTIAIGEGIETCLSAHILHGYNVWATTSVGGMLQLDFPERVKRVVWLVDEDKAGKDTSVAVWIKYPHIDQAFLSPTSGYKDFNDQLRGQ